jgi:hypothetical protein
MDHLHSKVCRLNCWQQQHETVLALATLGGATKNRKDPIYSVVPPKVAKARTMVTVNLLSPALSH